MRIAYVAIKGMPIGGGIEKLTEELGARLVQKGHEVKVYCSRDFGTLNGDHKGMQIKTVPSLNTKSLHKMSICFNAMLDIIRNGQVDIVHVHAVGPSIFSIFSKLKGIPTVVQTHGLEWKRDKWGKLGKLFFWLSDFTAVYFPHQTTSVSYTQKRYYENRFGKKVVYIPTGVSPSTKVEPDWILRQGLLPDCYILFAARLVEEKGAHYLLKAFRQLDTDMKLVIAGDAAHAEKYKSLLRQIAADDRRILFTGFVTGPPLQELFSNAYLFSLPSTVEGLPIALLEAMSYGNCCLVSDIPENIEALGDNGYTFENRNVSDLRDKLAELIQNPEMCLDKKDIARTYALQRYSWDHIAEKMENLYHNLITNHQR